MKNIMKQLALPVLLSMIAWSPVSVAEIAIVVHPDNDSTIDKRTVRNIFLGKARAYPNGSKARPLDLSAGDDARTVFVDKVLRKSESNLNAYWARMLFSSKAKPPTEMSNAAEVLNKVKSDKRAIAYVDVADVDDSVKVVMVIN